MKDEKLGVQKKATQKSHTKKVRSSVNLSYTGAFMGSHRRLKEEVFRNSQALNDFFRQDISYYQNYKETDLAVANIGSIRQL